MKNFFILIGLTAFLSFSGRTQFSDNREKFVKEFQKTLSDYGKGEYTDFAKEVLPQVLLEGSSFSDEHFSKMIVNSNQLIEKRLKVYPDVYNYVYSMFTFTDKKLSEESFVAWHASVDKLKENRNSKKIAEFLEFSEGFFKSNKISSSSNYNWYYYGGTYEFIFDKKAFIQFHGGNLVCRVHGTRSDEKNQTIDSLLVKQTSGLYNLSLKRFEGQDGVVTWEKVGLNANETFAAVTNYTASLKGSSITFDTVSLTTSYFSQPIKGKLMDRALKINRESDKKFPDFSSFKASLKISNIVPEIDYEGGFSLQGATFVGEGNGQQKATLSYKSQGKVFIKTSGDLIQISESRVEVFNSECTLMLSEKDSIYHPGATFRYDLEKKNISFTREGNGLGQAPFKNSYHKLDMYVAKVSWDLGADNVDLAYEFGTSQEQKMARFESVDYFDVRLYDQLQGMSTTHPLVGIWQYCYKYDEYTISEGKAATALGLSVSQAKGTLLKLSSLGFIVYDTERKIISVNEKLETFVEAKAGKKDFDNLIFVSDFRPKKLEGYSKEQIQSDPYLQRVEKMYQESNNKRRILGEFGSISLSSQTLKLNGVDNVEISQRRNTVVFPNESEVTIFKNRDFKFKGWVNSGKLELNAEMAEFYYEDFKFKIGQSNEALFRVNPFKKSDSERPIAMQSKIHGIVGEILVDTPSNKSGEKAGSGDYPKLISKSSTKVFYNDESIYNGAYDSTRFYYTVDPFEKDSLATFSEKHLEFSGKLTSAGIFPVIDDSIRIMPDYSFGFVKEAPKGGYTFYGTEAKYENKIALSHRGLQGQGVINFIHSTSTSKQLSFLPDSTVGYAQFINEGIGTGVEFPDVKGEDVYITYVPREDVLKVMSTPKNDLAFFSSEVKLRGTAQVKPEGMTGRGLMIMEKATFTSNEYSYKRNDVFADTMNFSLKNQSTDVTEDPLAFNTNNVNGWISLKDRKGEFKSNDGESIVDFPVNQYMCKMDMFTWLMDDESIEMQKDEDPSIAINTGIDLVGPNFFSTHPKQDSLQFRAPKARFELKTKTITCDKVEYIDVADARIAPDSMRLIIRKRAKMDKLENATIVANYVTKYHTFRDAEVEITARKKYTANGRYPYYDKDSTLSFIEMPEIKLDSSFQTVASGKITEEEEFKLSKEFDFYGTISVRASNPTILFSGATKINHNCSDFDRNWMAFTSEIDPKNIQIPVSNSMKNLEGNPISAGLVWRDSPSTDSLKIYPTFLSALIGDEDPIVLTANGYLQYNEGAKEFQIAGKEKLINRSEPGNFIALHTESCSMQGNGVINLGMDYGDLTVDAVGTANYNQSTGKTTMNITARFTTPMDKKIFQDVAERLNEIPGMKPMVMSGVSNTLEEAIIQWDGVKAADKFKDEFVREGSVKKIPNSLQTTFTITGIKLESYNNGDYNGLITTNTEAAIVNFYNKPVLKNVPFKLFFQQAYLTGNDKFSLFINVPGGYDYFMDYSMKKKDGTLRIKSGDVDFNNAVTEIKEEKRKIKNFKYGVTSSTVMLMKFLELFK